MKIAIEANQLMAKWSGVRRYLVNLTEALAKIDHKNQYILFYHFFSAERLAKIPPAPNRRFQKKFLRLPDRVTNFLWQRSSLFKAEMLTGPIDVFHAPYFLLPRTLAPTVLTVLDILHLKYPFYYQNTKWYTYTNKILPQNLKRTTKIIAISQQVKNDLLDLFDLSPEKIKVIHLGVEERFFEPQKEMAARLARYNLTVDGYLLYVMGTSNPRKNLPNLIRAYKLLPADTQREYPLIVVSGLGEIKITPMSNVFLLRNIDDNDLPLLYQGCFFFVYPSLAEGFGLPILEAMASGKAVITSNRSAMPEIVGKTGLLVDPQSPIEIKRAILKLINDQKLRKRLAKMAKKRARRFSWEKCARETLKVYNEINQNSKSQYLNSKQIQKTKF